MSEQFLIELTPERKQRLERVGDQIIDILRKDTESPAEAFIALQFVRETLEEMTGLHMDGRIIADEA
jgi:hypothetical protein